MRFKVHPLFYALAIILVLFGQAQAFVWAFVAVCMHEGGHALAAKARGYALTRVVLLPYGAAMSARDELDGRSGVIVGLAGPAVNIFAALITLGVWWLFPAVYPYTEYFLYANLSIGLFNLLPVYPLDGSRVVLGLAHNRLKAVRGLQITGIAVSVTMFCAFVTCAFVGLFNFTLGVMSLFLFYGAAFATEEETYKSVLAAHSKNYGAGVTEKKVFISRDATVARLFQHVDGRSITVFAVVDDENPALGLSSADAPRVLYTLTETDLKRIAAAGRMSDTLREAENRKSEAVLPDNTNVANAKYAFADLFATYDRNPKIKSFGKKVEHGKKINITSKRDTQDKYIKRVAQ